MKVGAIYPQIELGGDPAAFDAIGRAVESLGYDFFVMFDHVMGAERKDRIPPLWGPYSDRDPFHNPFVAFGYLAAITKRVDLVTGVMVLPQRPTVLVARQVADMTFSPEVGFVSASVLVGIPLNSKRWDRISAAGGSVSEANPTASPPLERFAHKLHGKIRHY